MTLKCIKAPSIASEKIREIHIFDLDRTLVQLNSSVLLARYLYEQKEISRRAMISCLLRFSLYVIGLSSLNQQINRAFNAFFRGQSYMAIARHVEPFWQERLQYELRQSIFTQLRKVQQKGQLSAIFSAGPDFLVEYVAKQLGVNFVLASEYRTDRTGRLFYMLGQVTDGRMKAQAVQRLRYRFKQASINGYSDSYDDREFLEVVDQAWIVQPDRSLRRWAKRYPHVHLWEQDN